MKINILDIFLSLGAVPSPKTLYSKYRRVNIPFNPNPLGENGVLGNFWGRIKGEK